MELKNQKFYKKMNELSFIDTPISKKFINLLMKNGKKNKSKQIYLKCLGFLKQQGYQNPDQIINLAIENVKPVVEIRSVRVGSSTHQIPTPLKLHRQISKSMKWIIESARIKKISAPMHIKLAFEFIDASKNQGSSIQRRILLHKLADKNRAFAHFRWY